METKRLLSTFLSALFVMCGLNAQTPNVGNYCNSSLNPLTNDFRIPMNGFNYNFTEDVFTPSSVRIGYNNCNPTTQARLNVLNDVHPAAGYFQTRLSNLQQAAGVASIVDNTNGTVAGFYTIATTTGSGSTIGLDASANDAVKVSDKHIGVNLHVGNGVLESSGVKTEINSSSSDENYGYHIEMANSSATSTNYGFNGELNTPGVTNYGTKVYVAQADLNVGIYAETQGMANMNLAGYFFAVGANDNMGIYASAPLVSASGALGYSAYFDGHTFTDGDIYYTGSLIPVSDRKFKTDVEMLENPLDIIRNLQPKTYYFDTTHTYDLHFPKEKQYGFIAQEVGEVVPDLVVQGRRPAKRDSLGQIISEEITYSGLNYNGLISILTAAVQEQQKEIDKKDAVIHDLNERLTKLENCLGNILPKLCEINHTSIETMSDNAQQQLIKEIEVLLKDRDNIVLNQNVPNPFAEKATISYTIPASVGQAEIIFYDTQGKIINTIVIVERGEGRLNVYADDLSSGIYSYTLFADGKVVATKRMMRE